MKEEFNNAATETSGLILIVASIIIALLAWILSLHRIIPIRILISIVPIFVGSYYFWSYFSGIVFSIMTCSSEEYFIKWLQSQDVSSEQTAREIQEELEKSLTKLQFIQVNTLSSNTILMNDYEFEAAINPLPKKTDTTQQFE